MKGKIYKIVCDVSSRERIYTICFFQPATDIRVAYRLMKEGLKSYYCWKFISLRYWRRWDIYDNQHYKIN